MIAGATPLSADGKQGMKVSAASTAALAHEVAVYYRGSRRDSTTREALYSRWASTASESQTVAIAAATSPAPLRVEQVVPSSLTDEEAREAVLQFIEEHPGADACDIADALSLPMRRAFAIADALIDEGEIEVAEE